jgi:hypothetical protein
VTRRAMNLYLAGRHRDSGSPFRHSEAGCAIAVKHRRVVGRGMALASIQFVEHPGCVNAGLFRTLHFSFSISYSTPHSVYLNRISSHPVGNEVRAAPCRSLPYLLVRSHAIPRRYTPH